LFGAEIGVYSGVNAETILKNLNIEKLYLIDPYESYMQSGKTIFESEKEKEAKTRLKEYENRLTYLKMKSDDAINLIPDYLDFIYIDGNHEYK
jgi:hypothetical protein